MRVLWRFARSFAVGLFERWNLTARRVWRGHVTRRRKNCGAFALIAHCKHPLDGRAFAGVRTPPAGCIARHCRISHLAKPAGRRTLALSSRGAAFPRHWRKADGAWDGMQRPQSARTRALAMHSSSEGGAGLDRAGRRGSTTLRIILK